MEMAAQLNARQKLDFHVPETQHLFQFVQQSAGMEYYFPDTKTAMTE